jgi:type IV secretory pathway VirB10-like protein
MTEYQKAYELYKIGLVGKEYLDDAKRKDRLHEQARTNAGLLLKKKPKPKPDATPVVPHHYEPHVPPPLDPPTVPPVTPPQTGAETSGINIKL